MSQITDFFKKLFDTSDWPARWHCGTWSDFHGWLYIISDLIIWLAYFAIPFLIIQYITTKTKLRFNKLYFLFAAFILACGTTHLLDAISFWYPFYRISALARAFTAVVSCMTVFQMIKFLPIAFSFKAPEELEAEVENRKKAEALLQIKNNQLNDAQAISRMGHWEWNVKTDKITWSEGLFNIYEIPYREEGLTYEDFVKMIHPDDQDYVNSVIKSAIETKTFNEYYHRIITPGKTIKILFARGEIISDNKGEIIQMMGTSMDVTELKKTEELLIEKSESLLRINEDLKSFAYITSHDLKEPLRKIRTFNSKLIDEYKNKLDDKANGYINKIDTSIIRMQNLIDDILEFASLSNEFEMEETDLNDIIQQVISDMEIRISESNAQITVDKLPAITAHPTQMYQLFQNLISNAIKFCKPNVHPIIKIEYKGVQTEEKKVLTFKDFNKFPSTDYCVITISDNGIGFDEIFMNKIFNVFQRLHNKQQYEGTGIGLAICKKIVENHNGLISAESKIEEGSKFTIKLPFIKGKNFLTLEELPLNN